MTKEEKLQEEQKRERKYNLFGTGVIVILFGLTVYMIGGVIIPRQIKEDKEKDKQSVIDKQVKRYEKTLPHYKEYLQTKEQIARYHDSLQRVIR